MSKVEDSLTQFASKVRQLIARYSDAKKEIEELHVAVESRDKEVEKLQKQLAQAHQDYESLKMARMIEVSDGDVEVCGMKSTSCADQLAIAVRQALDDTDIPVNIRREDEFYYREAAKLISNTVNTYADRYKSRNSDKEIMYMAMIDIALRLQRQKGDSDTSELDKILSALTSEIDGIL